MSADPHEDDEARAERTGRFVQESASRCSLCGNPYTGTQEDHLTRCNRAVTEGSANE